MWGRISLLGLRVLSMLFIIIRAFFEAHSQNCLRIYISGDECTVIGTVFDN